MQFAYVGAVFTNDENKKAYTYKYPIELNLQPGDLIVVPVGATFRPTLAKVLGVKDDIVENPKIKYKYVIDRVDFSLYEAIPAELKA